RPGAIGGIALPVQAGSKVEQYAFDQDFHDGHGNRRLAGIARSIMGAGPAAEPAGKERRQEAGGRRESLQGRAGKDPRAQGEIRSLERRAPGGTRQEIKIAELRPIDVAGPLRALARYLT